MKTFSDFILEARGSSDEKLIQTRGKIELLRTQMSSTNDPTKKEELKKQIRKLQSLLPTPGKGRPQKPRDVITSGKTTKGSLPDVPSSGDDPQARGGRRVAGRYGNPAGTTGSGGTLRSRTGDILGAG
jgi:hypothetical protein